MYQIFQINNMKFMSFHLMKMITSQKRILNIDDNILNPVDNNKVNIPQADLIYKHNYEIGGVGLLDKMLSNYYFTLHSMKWR